MGNPTHFPSFGCRQEPLEGSKTQAWLLPVPLSLSTRHPLAEGGLGTVVAVFKECHLATTTTMGEAAEETQGLPAQILVSMDHECWAGSGT